MPSFFSKVFSRKGQDKEASGTKRTSDASLLEGKFEAVSPPVSPEARHFAEAAQQPREKDKDTGFALFRTKSRPTSPPPDIARPSVPVPRLTLNLPVPKEERSRALGVVFEGDPDDNSTLPDGVIGERRLNPLETLLLVKACSTAIVERGGLETLGVMHSHWYSASPDVQRKLISLFILSVAPRSPITTLSPSPTSPSAMFNTELEYTRSPHDIAAVLRWALRHVRLEGDSFGDTPGQWDWYSTFLNTERAQSYPPKAFSEFLIPKLPPAHHQLLVATLEIVSSVAAHSEYNGISGSKLSKSFGLWLLTMKRAEEGDDWSTFYARWERAGRVLEHLFLAHIRDETTRGNMPLRLSELTKGYPYSKQISPEEDLLPRPRLSTRSFDALHIRLETELPDHNIPKSKQHPLRIVSDAFRSELLAGNERYDKVWDAIKSVATSPLETDLATAEVEAYPILSRVFGDETIRLLTIVPADNSHSAAVTLNPPVTRFGRPTRRRSLSLGHKPNGNSARTNGTTHTTVSPAFPTADTSSATSPTAWSDFSAIGFGDSGLGSNFASTLFDSDVEVTSPPSRKPSKRQPASPDYGRRSSVDNPNPTLPDLPRSPKQWKTKASVLGLTKIDEAFVDFWSDGLADPVASNWPNFLVAQLKPLPDVESIGWLVIEQTFRGPPPPPEPVAPPPVNLRRASSPRPSLHSEVSGRKSSTFAGARKRFSFFSAGSRESVVATHDGKSGARKKAAKAAKIGEMGEILAEVEERSPPPKEVAPPVPAKQVPSASAAPTALGLIGVEDGTGSAPAVAAPDVPDVQSGVKDSAKAADAPVDDPSAALSDADPFSPRVEAASPVSFTDTPTAADFPPVPVDAVRDVSLPATPVAIAPIETEDTAGKTEVSVPEDVIIPAEAQASSEAALPPAPETVVLAGETPGPQVALETSEPVALVASSTDTQAEIVQEPLVAESTEELSGTAEQPVVAVNGNATGERIEEAPTHDIQEEEPPVQVIVDAPPSTTDEVSTPQELIAPHDRDVIAEAAGDVIEQTAAIPTTSEDTVNDVAIVRPPIDVIVSSPTERAVRAVSATAEVLVAAADLSLGDSSVEAAVEDRPAENGHTVEVTEDIEVQESSVEDTHKTDEQLAELEDPSVVAVEPPVEPTVEPPVEPTPPIPSEPSPQEVVAPPEEVIPETTAHPDEAPAPSQEQAEDHAEVEILPDSTTEAKDEELADASEPQPPSDLVQTNIATATESIETSLPQNGSHQSEEDKIPESRPEEQLASEPAGEDAA